MKFIRFVGRACSDSEYTAAVTSKCWGVCDRFTDRANVAFEFHRSAKPITFRLSAEHQDFVDLATLLYVADQASARAASADFWTRDQSFVVPVSNPDLNG
jgi:hypothetical protein